MAINYTKKQKFFSQLNERSLNFRKVFSIEWIDSYRKKRSISIITFLCQSTFPFRLDCQLFPHSVDGANITFKEEILLIVWGIENCVNSKGHLYFQRK